MQESNSDTLITLIIVHTLLEDDTSTSFLINGLLEDEHSMQGMIHAVCANECVHKKHIRPTMYDENWIPRYSAEDFYSLYRMCPDTLKKLLNIINEGGAIEKGYVGGHSVIQAEKKLLVTITYLGHQMSMLKIGKQFNLPKSSVHNVIHKCIQRIIQLKERYVRWLTKEEKDVIACRFKAISNFPNVIGAIDASHINVKPPKEQRDSYTNRKMGKSVILQAVCTSERILTNVCIGFPGSAHDARVLKNSSLYRSVEENGKHILFDDKYHLIGDSAYPLTDWLITPFRDYGDLSQKQIQFNKCLSSTRCVIENVFGLLKGRWRRLHYIDTTNIKFASDIILACCILHNFCLLNNDLIEHVCAEDVENEEVVDIPTHDMRASGQLKREHIIEMMNL